MKRFAMALALGPLLAATPLVGQSAVDLAKQALAAYRARNYDRAAALVRSGLAVSGGEGLVDSARAASFVLLGAAHLSRGRPDSAMAAFREALAADPRVRPDRRTFPVEVNRSFLEARQMTAFVRFAAPADTTIPLGERYPVRVYASGIHETTVELANEAGKRIRRLYIGLITDSLNVRWDGLDSVGGQPLTGAFALQVTLRPADGPKWVTRLPIVVAATSSDTLVPPPRPAGPAPARAPALAEPPPPVTSPGSGRRPEVLAAGVLSGLAVMVLPKLVAADGRGSASRFLVGGTLGLAGVVGFIAPRARRPMVVGSSIPAGGPSPRGDIQLQPDEEAWRRAVDSVRAENDRRRQDVRLRIKTGEAIGPEIGDP